MSGILFCDWETGADDFDQTSFFDLGDLTGYELIFFDPLTFAVRHGIRNNQADIWIKEYPAFVEAGLLRYAGIFALNRRKYFGDVENTVARLGAYR